MKFYALLPFLLVLGGCGPQTTDTALNVQSYCSYARQEVKVDGQDFEHCTFVDVTFRYDGGSFRMNDAHIVGTVALKSKSDSVNGVMIVLREMGVLRAQKIIGTWGAAKPPSERDAHPAPVPSVVDP